MTGLLTRLLGERVVHKAAGKHIGHGGALDVRLGFALFRDRRVPLRFKLLALLLGAGLVGLMVALEIPVELLLGIVIPFLGPMLDFTVDGLEMVIGPVAFGALLLPLLAPRLLVDQIRAERAGVVNGVVLDAQASAPVLPALPGEETQVLHSTS